MIIRKPYAFLIKYFQVIHIIVFIFMTYYTYIPNMVLNYINISMIILSISLVGLLLLIFFLMKQKEKKVLYYLLGTIYYFLSFVLYLFFLRVFNNLEYR